MEPIAAPSANETLATPLTPEQAEQLVSVAPLPCAIERCSDGHLLHANQVLAELWGVAGGELLGRASAEIYDDSGERATLFEQLEAHGQVRGFEIWLRKSNGSRCRAEVSGRLVSLDGKPAALWMFGTSCKTDRSSDALRASEEKYRLMIEETTQGVWTIDAQGKTTYANARMAKILRCSREELLSSSMYDFADPAGQKEAQGNLGRRADGIAEIHEFKFIRKDGTEVWTELCTAPYFDKDGAFAGGVAMVQDISERKQLERDRQEMQTRLRHTEKLEALGALVSGIAHDFNNLLVPIIGQTELLLRKEPADPDIIKGLQSIRLAARRSAEVVGQFLAFSRDDVGAHERWNVGPLVASACRLLRAALPTSVALDNHVDEDLGWVLVDESRIHQVFLNLGANAAQATAGRGRIAISAERAILDSEQARLLGTEAGSYIVIKFRDNGAGIAPEVLPRIFDPYFTTKAVGEGTGLGLAAVHGILRGHGGAVSVESTPGTGSEFSLYLPDAEASERAVRRDHPKTTGPSVTEHAAGSLGRATRPLHILVIDDEPLVLDVMVGLLEDIGHQVRSFECPVAALEAFRADLRDLDLVITDYTMPGMSGTELAEAMHELAPSLPIILCSGRLAGSSLDAPRGVSRVVMKPYEPEQMLRVVDEVLAVHQRARQSPGE